MDKDYTHFTVILDRSGSMGFPASVWKDTIGGLKSTITKQKAEEGKCTFSLYNFDDKIEQNLDFVNIQLVSESVEDLGLYPRGGTALYDAIGRAIKETGKKLSSLKESERPGRVVVIVQTDGQENQSREFKAAQIAEMLKEQEEKYNWQFQFVGSNKDAVLDATKNLGFKLSNTAFYSADKTNDTFDLMNMKLAATRSACYDTYAAGETLAFSDAEKSSLI